jgi:hypothetical protein
MSYVQLLISVLTFVFLDCAAYKYLYIRDKWSASVGREEPNQTTEREGREIAIIAVLVVGREKGAGS